MPNNAILRSVNVGLSWSKDTDVTPDLVSQIKFADAHSPIAVGVSLKVFRGIGY